MIFVVVLVFTYIDWVGVFDWEICGFLVLLDVVVWVGEGVVVLVDVLVVENEADSDFVVVAVGEAVALWDLDWVEVLVVVTEKLILGVSVDVEVGVEVFVGVADNDFVGEDVPVFVGVIDCVDEGDFVVEGVPVGVCVGVGVLVVVLVWENNKTLVLPILFLETKVNNPSSPFSPSSVAIPPFTWTELASITPEQV